MERPALQRLLADINDGRIDVVVVYKVDRLTRSLADFAKMVEIFDAHRVSFVSVTQQFNTTTSMGRLTLNVLLSFAQFEREVTGERIRDKIAASKKKGMWMGGVPPLGYDIRDRRLVINKEEAELVRSIYRLYIELGGVRLFKKDLDRRGIVSKVRISRTGVHSGGRSFSRGALYQLLANPIYLGEIRHRAERHPGLHIAILDHETWEKVQTRLRNQTVRDGKPTTKGPANWLAGKLFDENGGPLYATGAKGRHGGRYRYYVSRSLVRGETTSGGAETGWRLAASEFERGVLDSVHSVLKDQSALATTLHESDVPSAEIQSILGTLQTFSISGESDRAETTNVAPLVKRVDLRKDGIELSVDLESMVPRGADSPLLTITRFIPLRIRRRGVAMRLVIGGGVSVRKADPTLLKAVARGYRWFQEVISDADILPRDIAARERVNERFVRRLIPLAFLAPMVLEAIVEGRQPSELTGEFLSRGIEIPVEWTRQAAALGFAD